MRRLLRRLLGLGLALIMIPAFARLPADLPDPIDELEIERHTLFAFGPVERVVRDRR